MALVPLGPPMNPRPVIATGQQIGAGWSPALAIAKALAALAEARRTGAEAVYWLADEDHDRAEVASVVGWDGPRLVRHRFRFDTRPGTATGWLPWTPQHQTEATKLWGPLPEPEDPTLRGHVLALGQPLWERGLRPFSPTDPAVREPIQSELERWRTLDLQAGLVQQADRLTAQGAPLPLDPRVQAPWFSLDPRTGRRQRLEPGEALAKGLWLSPGAALRPLMQSLLLPVSAVVLGPSERAYWRLCEPFWVPGRASTPGLARSRPVWSRRLRRIQIGPSQSRSASGVSRPAAAPAWGSWIADSIGRRPAECWAAIRSSSGNPSSPSGAPRSG